LAEQLADATGDDKTRLPDGMRPAHWPAYEP
jgi:hypothetical protein